MSVEQRGMVDAIGSSKPDGHTVLNIIDGLPWLPDNEHLLILQNKINDYIEFLQSGQLFEARPQARGLAIEIQIVFKFKPAGDGIRFLQIARETIRQAGFQFSTKTLSDPSQTA
jgi:hypothetical protein